ncbi:hypothetical protein [Salisediminibacterium beveridgei]|uniref:Lipoprotein n=1 Tax=Salisediminibacterium beveridgei TaxID=632773 RepID=A0A1D7QT02_9BACI|nr:hypothetical protein [Salisediminibacterium beveridgei]AOM82133.1 hypothetical protein BBEV_0762 [Salisediminibacterium beveridgei]
MKKRWISLSLSALIAAWLIAGCSVSEEHIKDEARSLIESKLIEEPKEPNEAINGLSFYGDREIAVEEVNEYNYVISAEDTTYLLFKNDDLDYSDQDEIRDDLMLDHEVVTFETFTNESSLDAYIMITEFDDGTYRLIVAVDGKKMTTVLPLDKLASNAEFMFDFVYSMAHESISE